MKIHPGQLLAAIAMLALQPVSAQEAYVEYDSFTVAPLSPARWSNFDRSRVISSDAMSLVMREYGGTGSDAGRAAGVSWGQNLTVPVPVTQLKANLRVNSFDVGSCAANTSSSRVRARLLATFFSTGNPSVGSYFGDVLAQLYLLRDSDHGDAAGVLRVEGNALVCTDSTCNTSLLIGSVSLGTVNTGQNVVLQLEWDKAGKRFVFSRDSGGQTAQLAYTQSDTAQPGFPVKSLGLRADLENCASGDRVHGGMDARFDSVQVNVKAKP